VKVPHATAQYVQKAAAVRLRRLLERPDLQMKSNAPSLTALVEQYIPGVEVAVEGILLDGELKILAKRGRIAFAPLASEIGWCAHQVVPVIKNG